MVSRRTENGMKIEQARKQEMKWGGVFCRKVENGVFFVKRRPFLSAGSIMYSISIFYILLIWQNAPPAYGPEEEI